MRLWEVMLPHLGRPWMRREVATERWVPDRAALLARLPRADAAREAFCARERDFMLHEFEVLGRLDALRVSLHTKVASARGMLDRLEC